jgi:hypothetical protein
MWITIGTPSLALEQVEATLDVLDGDPEGPEARYVGTTADGDVRIVALWESKEHAERFFAEKLGPVIARVLGPEPAGAPADVIGIDVVRQYVRQPVA